MYQSFFVLCVINWLICLLLIGVSRFLIRQVYWGIINSTGEFLDERKNLIIYGAGSAGIQLANALYFSRCPIPWGDSIKWHHLGIYGWDRSIIEKYIKLKLFLKRNGVSSN